MVIPRRPQAAFMHREMLPCAAAMMKIVLEAGGPKLFSRTETDNFKQNQ